jgi:hypothetical protein
MLSMQDIEMLTIKVTRMVSNKLRDVGVELDTEDEQELGDVLNLILSKYEDE